MQQAEASKTEQGLAANDTSDFPDFEKNSRKHKLCLRLAGRTSGIPKDQRVISQRPAASDTWMIENQINSSELQRFKLGVSELAVFNKGQSLDQPVPAPSCQKPGLQWPVDRSATAFGQIAAAVKAESTGGQCPCRGDQAQH